MTTQPEIAIIEPNTLSSLGLKSILEEIIPMATIRTFHRFNELMDDTPDMYAHYFISAQIYVEHNAFFRCVMTVVRLIFSLSAISLLISPLVISTSTSISRADKSS